MLRRARDLRALAAALLFIPGAAVSAAPAPDILPVKTYSALIAAEFCAHHGFAYMVKLGVHDFVCVRSAAGIAKRAVRVQDVISAAERQVRGQ